MKSNHFTQERVQETTFSDSLSTRNGFKVCGHTLVAVLRGSTVPGLPVGSVGVVEVLVKQLFSH